MDSKEMKVTIVGDFDPIHAISKLRNTFPEETITIGPAKEQETNKNKIEVAERITDQRKVSERKRVQSEVDEGKSAQSEQVAELVNLYQSYYPNYYQSYNPYMQQYYYTHVPKDDPKSCVIC